MNVDTKIFLYSLLASFALIGIGFTIYGRWRKHKTNLNWKICGIFSMVLGALFALYRTLLFLYPPIAQYAGLLIIIGLIVVNILVFTVWNKKLKSPDKNKPEDKN